MEKRIADLVKLNEEIQEKLQNASGLVYSTTSVSVGKLIHHTISLLSKEPINSISEDDLPFIEQVESIARDFLSLFAELDNDNWFENVVINHCDDELYYPNQIFAFRARLVETCHHFSDKFGEHFKVNFTESNDDQNQCVDHKQILKYLKNYSTTNETEKKKIEDRINVIMRKGLYLTKSQNEKISSKLREISNININDNEIEIEPGDKLGSGGFGTVMKGTFLKTSEVVAVKEVRIDRISSNSTLSFYVEIMTMHSIKHSNVLKLVGAHIEFPFRIITRFCSGRSLFDRLHRPRKDEPKLDAQELTKIAYQVALGMEYLHSQSIVHRDLKTLNILLDAHNNACVADFGLSGNMKNKEQLWGGVGTPNYTAPEILARIHYNSQVDVYSYAIVLWEMLLNRIPFSDLQPVEIYDHVVRNNWRLPLPQESPKGLKKLITQCWSKNPKERPTFKDIVAMFRNGQIFFRGTEKIDCEQIEKERYCPPLNETYLFDVLHKKRPEYFDSVVNFIVNNMDAELQNTLRESNILYELVQTPEKHYASTLLLASAILKADDSNDFATFLHQGGRIMFQEALKEHSTESLTAALTFATKMSQPLIPTIKDSLGIIVSLLGDNDPTPDGIVIQLLTRFDRNLLIPYIPRISQILRTIPVSKIDNQKTFNSVTQLIEICSNKLDELQVKEKADLRHFASFISLDYAVSPNFVHCIIKLLQKDIENLPVLVMNILEAMKYSDLSEALNNLIINIDTRDQTIFDQLAQNAKLLDLLCNCLKEKQHLSAPLFLFFCIARRAASPPILANHEIISALLDMRCCNNQRLQIFAALTISRQFCKDVRKTSTMDGIIHLLSSSFTSEQQLINSSVRLILSMSTHKTGCKILQKNDVFELFVQHFLSSSVDLNASYTIIRNAMRYDTDIPQIPLIASCLLQSLLYDMSSKEKILDTLVALVKKAPLCVQTRDLQVYVLRFTKQEAPLIVLQSLRLLKSVDVKKLSASGEMANSVLTAVNQVLKYPGYHHPKIITAALSTIQHLLGGPVKIDQFLKQTKIVDFAKNVIEMIPPNKTKIIEKIDNFIKACNSYMNLTAIQDTPLAP